MTTESDVWTADMLDDVPDDGRRWEVIDGKLLEYCAQGVDDALVISLPELFAEAFRGL